MSNLTVVGIVLAALVALFLLHHLIAYHLKIPSKWKKELEEIETVGWYGPFYINKNDERVFLPKRWGIGFTLNLGQPTGIILFVAIIGFAVWSIVAGTQPQ